ncbi:metallophosphoesterase [Priestia endophytica]|uniref:metallophosphoesterase n=1 Tax=Priestia endophytica TaxID=135735 RepID=UPI002280A5A8|nr:metallophosphoesterase [Priestia endophytica]MCY8235262.1 metallophosphoesterase [Priestia endophytica]
MRKKKKRWIVIFLALIFLLFFCYFQNNSIAITKMTISSRKISSNMNGYKIVQLSDLHSKEFGENQGKLVQKVNKLKPDLIVFTGDLVDSEKYNEEISMRLMEKLVEIAPTYFVTGNHEWWSGNFHSLESKLNDIGVHVMRNTADVITMGGSKAYIVGIDDPAQGIDSYEAITRSAKGLKEEPFKILLAHRPEMFSLYVENKFDLVFSGHAHGGQVRMPFVGGLIAPNQGWFPKYTAGKYTSDNTTMIVNRGLGNSVIPLRIFNRPEIVAVTLRSIDD